MSDNKGAPPQPPPERFILRGHCAGGGCGLTPQEGEQQMAAFLAAHAADGDRKYLCRISVDDDIDDDIDEISEQQFAVVSFTCALCERKIQVPVCQGSFHGDTPLFPYTWLRLSHRGYWKSASMTFGLPELKRVKDQNKRTLWFTIQGNLDGEVLMRHPPVWARKLKLGSEICGVCKETRCKPFTDHLWSH